MLMRCPRQARGKVRFIDYRTPIRCHVAVNRVRSLLAHDGVVARQDDGDGVAREYNIRAAHGVTLRRESLIFSPSGGAVHNARRSAGARRACAGGASAECRHECI